MEIKGEQRIELAREKVWDGLMDARVLQASVPGCEEVTDHGDGTFDAVVMASVGPVRARFKGRITQRNLDKPGHYELDFEGDSGMAGFAKGSATVNLQALDDHTTLLTYAAQSKIGGRLAQIGSRLIDATVARMSKQFFERFEAVLKDPSLLDDASQSAGQTAPAHAASGGGTPAVARPASGVVLQMPSWVFVTSLVVFAVLVGWLAAQ